MNDFSELEADLKKLRPTPISDDLVRRVEQEFARLDATPTAGLLAAPRARATGWRSFGLGLTGLTALVVIGLIYFDRSPRNVATTGAQSGFQPVGLSQVVYSGRDEGLVFPPNDKGAPRRRLRYETRETMHWRNAATGASVRVSYPVEQVVLTPISFQ